MAKLKSPLFSIVAMGTIDKKLIYRGRKGFDDVKKYTKTVNPDLPGQKIQKGYFKEAIEAWKIGEYSKEDKQAWDLLARTIKKSISGFNIFTGFRINADKENKTWTKLTNCIIYDVNGGGFKVDIDVESDLSGILYLGTSKLSMIKEFTGTFSVNKYTFTIKGLSKNTKYYFHIKNTSVGEEGRTGIYSQKTGAKVALDIDIGCPAIWREYLYSSNIYTIVNVGNPANESGKIKSIEIFCSANRILKGVTVATFYVVNGNSLSTRDYVYIGDVLYGYKQTFAVDLDVVKGDYIGFVSSDSSYIFLDISGGDNLWSKLGNFIPCTNEIFGVDIGCVISLYGTGKTII